MTPKDFHFHCGRYDEAAALVKKHHYSKRTPFCDRNDNVLTEKDMSKLATGNPDWLPIVSRAWELTEGAFVVGEVLRSSDRQAELFRDGKTKTMNSRHLTGDAVDLFAVLPSGAITWVENRYIPIGKAMKQAATEHGKSITWGALKKYGGDFRTFNDMVHFEFQRD